MKCPKCSKQLDIVTNKKYGGKFALHKYPLDLVLGNTDFSVCKYTKRIK